MSHTNQNDTFYFRYGNGVLENQYSYIIRHNAKRNINEVFLITIDTF